jgi:PAS domain S-box-containing protein
MHTSEWEEPRPSSRRLLSEQLHRAAPALLDDWLDRVRNKTAAGGLPDVQEGPDHLPLLLDAFTADFEELADRHADSTVRGRAEDYALARIEASIDLVDCLRELHELRAATTLWWWREHAPTADVRELVLLGRALDELTTRVVDAYAATRVRVLASLDRLASVVLDQISVDDAMRQLLRIVVDGVPTLDTASVFLVEGERLTLRATVGFRDAEVGSFSLRFGEGFAGRVAAARAPRFTASAATDPEVKSPLLRRRGVRALHGVPLISHGQLVGVATFGSLREDAFSKSTVQLLAALAARAADVIAHELAQAERARLLAEIEESRERLRTVVQRAPVGLAILDGESLVVKEANPAFVELASVGHPDENLVGRRFDGRCATILIGAAPVQHNGSESGAIAAFLDITEQRRLAVELERQRAELGAVVDAIADALVVADRRGKVVRLNRAAEAVLGLTSAELSESVARRAELLGLSRPDGARLDPAQIPIARALRGEIVSGELLRMISPRDGTALYLSVSAAPIRLPTGEVEGAVATFLDVTRLQQMREQMEDMLRMLGHDLRAPLASVLLHAQLLERTAKSDEVTKRARQIATSAKRMSAMIDDLVELTRAESGGMKLDLQPVRLREFAIDVVDRLAGARDERRIRVEVPEDLPTLRADPARLERVLVNLLDNALKYSPSDAPVVVSAYRGDDFVRLQVTDRGAGIPPEDLPHLFERYYRAERARRGRVEGIGLGLYITRLLTEAHGARIAVESEVGRGTTFTVTFPSAPTTR